MADPRPAADQATDRYVADVTALGDAMEAWALEKEPDVHRLMFRSEWDELAGVVLDALTADFWHRPGSCLRLTAEHMQAARESAGPALTPDQHKARVAETLRPLGWAPVAETRAKAAEEIADLRAALSTASGCADRFRDVIAEALDLPENPGDDELVAQLRSLHGKTGPEPTRWREFVADAAAILRPRHPDNPASTEEPTHDD